MHQDRVNKLQVGFLALAALVVGGLFVEYWRFAYSSDYAMVGLLAKRILTTGEQFIFIPKVGYQGLLYEANLVALMFRFFGVGPRVINFAPLLTYLGFCFFFYRAVLAWHGSRVARVALLFVIFSTPEFYGHVLRTQPNYGETFLMGSACIWIYHTLFQGGWAFCKNWRRPEVWGLFALFGFLSGFGLYTYGQILFFLGAIGLHLWILAWGDTRSSLKREVKEGSRFQRGVQAFLRMTFIYSLVFTLLMLFGVSQLRFSNFYVKWDPLSTALPGWILFCLVVFLSSVQRHFKKVESVFPSFAFAGLGFWVGLSPKLYYKYFQQGPTNIRMELGGNIDEVWTRTQIMGKGWVEFLGFSEISALHWVGGVLAIGTVLFFLGVFSLALGRRLFANSKKLSQKSEISPFFLLWVTTSLAFLFSRSVIDEASKRYLLATVLSFSVGMGWVVDLLLMKKSRKPWVLRTLVAISLFTILGSNALHLRKTLIESEKPLDLEKVANYLLEKDLKYGFGSYWNSYVVNFFTDEKVIVEPVGSFGNYIPYYLEEVKKHPRVVLLESGEASSEERVGREVELYQNRYRIQSMKKIGAISVFVLDKLEGIL